MGKIFMTPGKMVGSIFPLLSSQVQGRNTTDPVFLNPVKSERIVLSYSTLTNSKHSLRCSRPTHQVLMANLKNQVVFRILLSPWSVWRAWVCWALCEHSWLPPPQKLAKIFRNAEAGRFPQAGPLSTLHFPRLVLSPPFPLPVCWLSYKVLPRSHRMHSSFHSSLHTGQTRTKCTHWKITFSLFWFPEGKNQRKVPSSAITSHLGRFSNLKGLEGKQGHVYWHWLSPVDKIHMPSRPQLHKNNYITCLTTFVVAPQG